MTALDDFLERDEDDRAQLAKDDRLAADPDFARRAAESAEWLRSRDACSCGRGGACSWKFGPMCERFPDGRPA